MRRMSTIYSRLSYGTGAGLTGAGVSEKTYSAATSPNSSWLIVETISGLTLSDWAIVVGIICTAGTFAVNWYYRRKEFQLKSGGA